MSDLYGEGSSREHVVGAKIQHLDLGDVDALEGDELERLQQELNEDAHMASQEDYYAILNLDHDASEEDIKAAYKRLCLVFHPDRHSVPEDKARAESKFQLIQKAYDVLMNPQARYIYDKYGAQMAAMSWKIGQPLKTPQEVMEEFEKKMLAAQDPISSKGEMFITVDATKYFSRRTKLNVDSIQFHRRPKSRGLAEILSFPEVTQVRIGHSWETRIGGSTTFSLQGVAVSRRIIGESSVSATLSHLIRPGWHASVTGTIGDQMGVSTSLQHTHRNSSVVLNASAETIYMPPRISVVGVRHFNAHNTGSITLSPGSYSLGSWGEGYEGLYDGSCTLAWHKFRAKDQISAILTAGTAESSASANYICSLGSDYRAKISCGFSNRRGLTSLIYASRRATRHLRVGCGVEFAAVTGTTFVLSLARKGQRLKFPVLLDRDFNSGLIASAIALPFFGSLALDHYYFKPKKREEFLTKVKFLRETHKEILEQRKRDAEEAVEVMKTSLQNKITMEMEKDGLVVLEALYGKLPAASLLHVQPLSSKGVKNMTTTLGRKISRSFSRIRGLPDNSADVSSAEDEFIDVTLVIQNLVNNSQLFISGGYSKASLLGFYDPCLGETKKLRVTYQFQGVIHQVEVSDSAPLAAPIRSHVVSM